MLVADSRKESPWGEPGRRGERERWGRGKGDRWNFVFSLCRVLLCAASCYCNPLAPVTAPLHTSSSTCLEAVYPKSSRGHGQAQWPCQTLWRLLPTWSNSWKHYKTDLQNVSWKNSLDVCYWILLEIKLPSCFWVTAAWWHRNFLDSPASHDVKISGQDLTLSLALAKLVMMTNETPTRNLTFRYPSFDRKPAKHGTRHELCSEGRKSSLLNSVCTCVYWCMHSSTLAALSTCWPNVVRYRAATRVGPLVFLGIMTH